MKAANFIRVKRLLFRSDGVPPLSGCGSNTESTEDLWSEDHYLPENYLPSPDYIVSAIQPRGASDAEDVEGRREMDETWDYDYDHSDNPKNGQSPGRFPFEEQYHSLGNLCMNKNPYRHEAGGRKFSAPVFTGIVRAGATGGARLRTPDGGSTEEEGEGGGGYFRGPFHRSVGGRRKVLTRTRPRYLATGPPPMPRLPWPTEGRCTLRRQPGFRHPRHLRPVRYHRPLSGCYDDGSSMRSSSIASSAGGSTSDFEPWSESTPPMPRKNPILPPPVISSSSSSSLTRHVPPPPLRRLNLTSTRPSGTPPLLRRPAPPPFRVRRLTDAEAAADSRRRLQDSMTDDELKSLHDVATGKVERKDSLVSEAKFDSLLSSLQSLASELERDFQDEGGANEESGARGAVGGIRLSSPRRKNSQESATDGSSLSTNY